MKSWETPNGPSSYETWSQAMKNDLKNPFQIAWNLGCILQVDPIPNATYLSDGDEVVQMIAPNYAWTMSCVYRRKFSRRSGSAF
jgi:hypothetical protein